MYRTLKTYTVNDKVWYELHEIWKGWIVEVGDLSPYIQGYNDKRHYYYNGDDTIIVREITLLHYMDEVTNWKQVILRHEPEQKEDIIADIAGLQAYYYEERLIKRFYKDDEYEECLRTHEAEYDEAKAQVHIWYPIPQYKIRTFRDCYKYDINGAHNEALCEIFPKAAKLLRKQFDERKEKPNNKKYVNYYVGCLAKLGYRKTYNWIVQRTTQKLLKAMDETGGTILYANTDGFITWHNKKVLDVSKELGDFKEEYHGDVRLYQDKNYIIFQYKDGDEVVTKGSCLNSVRDMIDLEKGKIVHYDRAKENNTYVAKNIKVEDLELWQEVMHLQ